MILEYEITQRIAVENGCEHIVDGVIRFDDLIRTDYTPTNFSAEPKNYLLRDGHVDWDKMQNAFIDRIHREWLEELGYDLGKCRVEKETREIINQEEVDLKKINDFDEGLALTESATI